LPHTKKTEKIMDFVSVCERENLFMKESFNEMEREKSKRKVRKLENVFPLFLKLLYCSINAFE
jgi:hypothetical protein